MPGIPQVTKTGPKTFIPASGVKITGGQLVVPSGTNTGRVAVAGAAAANVLGVALTDAQSPEGQTTQTAGTIDADNRNIYTAAFLPTRVALAYGGIEVPVTYAANANFGDKLVAAANGAVTAAGATPDARTIVGTCTEPLGVVVATNAVGLMRTV